MLTRLEGAASDGLDKLGRLFEDSLSGSAYWQALAYADRIAADPRASVSRRAEAFRAAGELRLQLGDYPGAARDLERATGAVPSSSDLFHLAEAKREQPDEALPFADRAAAAAGATLWQRAKANLLSAELRVDLGDVAGAEKKLFLVLKDAPEDLDALSAMVRLKRGNKPAALPYAQRAGRAAAKAPLWRRPAALRLGARLWLELSEPAQAAELLRRALRFNPEDMDALTPLVAVHGKLTAQQRSGFRRDAPAGGADSEATASSDQALARALERDPDDLEALRQFVERHRRRPAEAAAYAERFSRSIWKTPVWQRAEAQRTLAALWRALGDDVKAYAALERAYESQSSLLTWLMFIAMPNREQDDEAIPNALRIYCRAAEMRLTLGDRAGAQETLRLGLALDPANAWALRLMAALARP